MIENRAAMKKVGAKAEARHKGNVYHATVTKVEDGDIAGVKVKELPGQEFGSLSTAGKAIMGGIAANGWRFFSPEGELPAARGEGKPKAAKKSAKAKTAKAAKAKTAKKPGKSKGKAKKAKAAATATAATATA